MAVLWCIQDNPSFRNGILLREACVSLGLDTMAFPSGTPDPSGVPSDRQVMFYGSCVLIRNVVRLRRWSPGAYFDEEVFQYSEYMRRYGPRMLNHDAEITTIAGLASRDLSGHDRLFVRSNADLKQLSGCVWPVADLERFLQRLRSSGNEKTLRLPVVVAPPKRIEYEWRAFIVDGRFSSGSQYRRLGDIEFSTEIPHEVVQFAEQMAALWAPARAFVMDVATCLGSPDLFVLELNGFNSSGFYRADVPKIVADIMRGLPAC